MLKTPSNCLWNLYANYPLIPLRGMGIGYEAWALLP